MAAKKKKKRTPRSHREDGTPGRRVSLVGLPTEEQSQIRLVFDALDTDGSDDLDYTELKDALHTFGVNLTMLELKEIWRKADHDASSSLTFNEFAAAIDALPERLPQRRASMEKIVNRVRGVTGQRTADEACSVM